MRTFDQWMQASIFRSQFLVSLAIGAAAAFTVLCAGLSLIKFHGGIWPWWFHGLAVALITGLITALLTHLHVREVSRREKRRLTGERMSHEICTCLQILAQCKYLQEVHIEATSQSPQRTQWEDEAIERLRVAAREILPDLLSIPASARPVPELFASKVEAERKSKATSVLK
jgi:phage gp46-like protein